MKCTNSKDLQAILQMLYTASNKTYKQLADVVNVTPQNIYQIINSKQHITVNDVIKVCDSLGMALHFDIKLKDNDNDISANIPVVTTDGKYIINVQDTSELSNKIDRLTQQITALQKQLDSNK